MVPDHRPTAPDEFTIRQALDSVDEAGYGRWWGTPAGAWLRDRITEKIGAPMAMRFSRQYGMAFDADDIANTAIIMLAQPGVLASVRDASDQWAYLYRTLRNEMFRQMGTRGISNIEFESLLDDDMEVVDSDKPLVSDAIARTIETLEPLTPPAVKPHLQEVISYLADRGQSRLSHAHTNSARDIELHRLGLGRSHILALANVVLGARPHHGRTSILAGFLRDAEWNPLQSSAHATALRKYEARMLRITSTEALTTTLSEAS